jgi:hypothetical protein
MNNWERFFSHPVGYLFTPFILNEKGSAQPFKLMYSYWSNFLEIFSKFIQMKAV